MSEPTKEDLLDPMFEAIWDVIKLWDISRQPAQVSRHRLYSGATGTDVMAILEVIRPFVNQGRQAGLKEAVEIVKKHEHLKWKTILGAEAPTTQGLINKLLEALLKEVK